MTVPWTGVQVGFPNIGNSTPSFPVAAADLIFPGYLRMHTEEDRLMRTAWGWQTLVSL